jgi:uroporphyrinogen decarboxylase
MIKNDLFFKSTKGVQRTAPVDDASSRKILPEFIALRDKYDFFHALSNARISCGNYSSTDKKNCSDAAILFSDILVIPQAWELKWR